MSLELNFNNLLGKHLPKLKQKVQEDTEENTFPRLFSDLGFSLMESYLQAGVKSDGQK